VGGIFLHYFMLDMNWIWLVCVLVFCFWLCVFAACK